MRGHRQEVESDAGAAPVADNRTGVILIKILAMLIGTSLGSSGAAIILMRTSWQGAMAEITLQALMLISQVTLWAFGLSFALLFVAGMYSSWEEARRERAPDA